MNNFMNTYKMYVYWENRTLTAREFLAFNKGLLRKLAQFDSVFGDLFIWGPSPKQKTWFAPDYSDLEEKLFPQLGRGVEVRYQNPDPDDWGLTLDSTFLGGFRQQYYKKNKPGKDMRFVQISAGGAAGTNSVGIEFPEINHPQFYEYDYVSALMKLLIEYCQPQEGLVTNGLFSDVVESDDVPGTTCTVGWLTYLENQSVDKILPPDIEREILTTGGTLITLNHSLPSAENEEDITSAIRIRDTLMKNGLLLGK
jgi:hypothetical protein